MARRDTWKPMHPSEINKPKKPRKGRRKKRGDGYASRKPSNHSGDLVGYDKAQPPD